MEAGGIGNADAGDSSASGTLSGSDVDDGERSFQSAAPQLVYANFYRRAWDQRLEWERV